jgi:hypothetical protein
MNESAFPAFPRPARLQTFSLSTDETKNALEKKAGRGKAMGTSKKRDFTIQKLQRCVAFDEDTGAQCTRKTTENWCSKHIKRCIGKYAQLKTSCPEDFLKKWECTLPSAFATMSVGLLHREVKKLKDRRVQIERCLKFRLENDRDCHVARSRLGTRDGGGASRICR